MEHLKSTSTGQGLTLAAVNRLGLIYPEEVQSYDDLIVATSSGLKRLEVNDLAGTLGLDYVGGWSPASLPSPRVAYDFGRRDTLFSDSSRATALIHDGTNEVIGSVTDLSGADRHLSQGTANDKPRYNSANLVNGRNYLEVIDTSDHMDLASAWVAGADAGSSFFSLAWIAYLPTAALQADCSLMVLGGGNAAAMGAYYNADGDVALRKEDAFSQTTTSPAPLDEWHYVVITYGYANGIKIWINSVAQTLTGTSVNVVFTGNTNTILRSDNTGWNSGAGGRIACVFGNATEWTADQVSLVNAYLAARMGSV